MADKETTYTLLRNHQTCEVACISNRTGKVCKSKTAPCNVLGEFIHNILVQELDPYNHISSFIESMKKYSVTRIMLDGSENSFRECDKDLIENFLADAGIELSFSREEAKTAVA